MNKKIGKFMAGLLALTMVLSMSLTAFAATKATVYYIDDANAQAIQQNLTADEVTCAWYYGDTKAQEYIMILDYVGEDGYEYFAFYFVDDATPANDEFDLCNLYEGTVSENAKGVISYKDMTDAFTGKAMNDFTMTPVNSTTYTAVFGDSKYTMTLLDGKTAVSYLAAMQDGVTAIQ